jgi:hypothetical protein
MRWILAFLTAWPAAGNATGGRTVLLPAPSAPTLEYRAALKADPSLTSPSEIYLSHRPSPETRDHLLAAYARARQAFLGQSPDEARSRYRAVADMALDDDWGRTERAVLLNSYLRLAQLDSDPAARDRWLVRALFLGPGLKPDATLFPPPLLRRLAQLDRESPKFKPVDVLAGGDWTLLLINGVPCSRSGCPDFPRLPQTTRVTLLSEKWRPQTLRIDLNRLAGAEIARLAWAGGDCGRPESSPEAGRFKNKQIFFGLKCARPDQAGTTALNLAPPVIPSMPKTRSKPFYQSGWFWAGVGTVALTAIWLGSRRHGEEKEPTTTYGE